MKTGVFFLMLFMVVSSVVFSSAPVYFLVADPNDANSDSYVLPLTDPDDIAYARRLIQEGPSMGPSIVKAAVECGYNDINRDYYSTSKRRWFWHVESFHSFVEDPVIIVGICGNNPAESDTDCLIDSSMYSYIGHDHYTIVEELGTCPQHWLANLNGGSRINLSDYVILAQNWLRGDCADPDWCDLADINRDTAVDPNDLDCFSQALLSPHVHSPYWECIPSDPMCESCWTCPYQCHGDADCEEEGTIIKYRVYNNDVKILVDVWPFPAYCGDIQYNPCADFDRDCDVDNDDVDILNAWYKKPVPADCPTTP